MRLAELERHIRSFETETEDYREALIEYHMKFSIPAACLVLGLLAIPLGLELRSNRKSAGLGMGLMVFIMYYVLLSAGRSLGEVGMVAPAWGVWFPNAIFGVAGVVMLVRCAREKSLYWMDGLRVVGRVLVTVTQRLMRRNI